MSSSGIILTSEPLTKTAFAPFGEVIEAQGAACTLTINNGLATRYHQLGNIDTHEQGGQPIISLFRSKALPLPHVIKIMERHPLGSQAFIPLHSRAFLVLVAPESSIPSADELRLFHTTGSQGVNLYRNTWHHFLIVKDRTSDFIVIDREGNANNLEECEIAGVARIEGFNI